MSREISALVLCQFMMFTRDFKKMNSVVECGRGVDGRGMGVDGCGR